MSYYSLLSLFSCVLCLQCSYVQSEERILWTPAEMGEFPWMVRILANFRARRKLCSASLISSEWLLTSAHCVRNDDSPEIAHSVVATFGRYDLNKYFEQGEFQRSSSNIIIHPQYNVQNYWAYDFALVKVNPPVLQIQSLSLPYSSNMCSGNYTNTTQPVDSCESAVALGWSTPDPNEPVNGLQKASLTIQSYSFCERTGRVLTGFFSQSKICAPGDSGNTKCLGDSGGPLMCKMSNGILYIIGVTSYGNRECNMAAVEQLPNIHSRVCSVYIWLLSYVEGISMDTTPAASCGQPPWIYNGLLSPGSSLEGVVRNITCFHGLQISGSPSIKCQNGQWTIPGKCIE